MNGQRCARSREISKAGWLTPIAVLALLPKCPACWAAYYALATGVSISISVATRVRFGVIALCITTVAYGLWRVTMHRRARSRFLPLAAKQRVVCNSRVPAS